MTKVTIERFAYLDLATVGRLLFPGGWVYTLEDPWNNNKVRESCIPEGWYEIRRDTFKGKYENFRFSFVYGRTAVEIHAGNTVSDTLGCPLLGESLVFGLEGQVAIPAGRSMPAVEKFMAAMNGIDISTCIVTSRLRRGL